MSDYKKRVQNYLIRHVNKLERHYTFHGKNVVFWSCKACRPKSQDIQPITPLIYPEYIRKAQSKGLAAFKAISGISNV
jgi:hypothetical protein